MPHHSNPEPWLIVDGQQVRGQRFGNFSRFTVKSRPKNIVIGSEVTPPNGSDERTLGVPVAALLIDGGRGRRYISMNEEVFPEGFYYVEKGDVGPWRWTNGSGRLDPVLWSGLDAPFHLSVFSS